jgi:hypothetical protein
MEVSDEISHEIKERREMNRRGQEENRNGANNKKA